MKCLDYRRALLTGQGETAAMRTHRLDCAFCAPLFDEQASQDVGIRRALEVPVPAGFEDRVLEAIPGTAQDAPPSPGRRRMFSAAAALGAGALGAGVYALLFRHDPIAMACIQFVMKEEAKSLMMGAMPREAAVRALADTLPLERLERIGQVRHIAPCPFGSGSAYHVILMVPQDKVTLLVMPDTPRSAPAHAQRNGMYASVIALGKGSVGVIGARREVVDSVVGALQG